MKEDLRDSFRKFVPKLSRELTEEVLKGFKKDRIEYNEYLAYFDIRDPRKPKSEDMKTKLRKEYIIKYTQALDKRGADPNDVLEEVDINRDGTLELNELSKVIKRYIKDFSYNDLRNLIDALDSNNDRKVSAHEYRDIIKKYGVIDNSKF